MQNEIVQKGYDDDVQYWLIALKNRDESEYYYPNQQK